MLRIFKQNLKSEYQERLKKSFPKKLHSDLDKVIKILPLKNHNVKLCDGNFHKVDNLIHESELSVNLDQETITIPSRLYFDEPSPELEKSLTNIQNDILNCIYLRHHNGYLREKRLNLISDHSKKWAVPFIFQLIGEYVYELLPVIDKKINERTLGYYVEFRGENPKYWEQTQSRMISYWNEHYRYEFPKLKEYLGYKIITRIKRQKLTY